MGSVRRAGLVKRHEQRAWTGGEPPYGYGVQRDLNDMPRVVIDPAEAETIRCTPGRSEAGAATSQT